VTWVGSGEKAVRVGATHRNTDRQRKIKWLAVEKSKSGQQSNSQLVAGFAVISQSN